jgi:GNAT superfamily N-acetyltransferase
MVQRLALSRDVTLLARFDADERLAAVFPDLRREALAEVVRHIDLVGRSGVVLYSRLSSTNVEEIARREIAYFSGIGQGFEWKVFSHDQPPDLVARLAALGFAIDEREAIMVLDLQVAGALPMSPAGIAIRRVTTRDALRDVASIKHRVYGEGSDELVERLAFELRNAPDYLSVYIASIDDKPAATAWIRFPNQGAFASLWGGSTLPELRHRGLYTALLAARIDEARRRGFAYLTVDAGAMSRPILEKRGFRVLTYATACTWHG